MKKYLSPFTFALLMLVFSISLFAETIVTNTVPAGGGAVPADGMSLLTAIIPLLVPTIIMLGKFIAPKIPSWILPYLAPLLGALIEVIQHLQTLSPQNVLLGAILGSAGVGVREVFDQSKQRIKDGPPEKTP